MASTCRFLCFSLLNKLLFIEGLRRRMYCRGMEKGVGVFLLSGKFSRTKEKRPDFRSSLSWAMAANVLDGSQCWPTHFTLSLTRLVNYRLTTRKFHLLHKMAFFINKMLREKRKFVI